MNRDIGLGIIGAAAAPDLVRIHSDPQSRLRVVGLCDSDARLAREAAERLGIPFVSTDPVDLVSQPEVDAVAVCGPTGERFSHCMAAMMAGKRVLCGNPMAATVAEAMDLARESDRRGGLLYVANPDRWIPEIARTHILVEKGSLGAIRWAEARLAVADGTGIDIGLLASPLDLLLWVCGDALEANAAESSGAITASVRFASEAVGTVSALRLPARLCDFLALDAAGDAGAVVGGRFVLSGYEQLPAMKFAEGGGARDTLGSLRAFEAGVGGLPSPCLDAWQAVKTVATLEAAGQSLRSGQPAAVQIVRRETDQTAHEADV